MYVYRRFSIQNVWWKIEHKVKFWRKCCEKCLHFYFCFGTILIVICHILLDLSVYGKFTNFSSGRHIRFVWKTFCTHRKVDRGRGWQIYFAIELFIYSKEPIAPSLPTPCSRDFEDIEWDLGFYRYSTDLYFNFIILVETLYWMRFGFLRYGIVETLDFIQTVVSCLTPPFSLSIRIRFVWRAASAMAMVGGADTRTQCTSSS